MHVVNSEEDKKIEVVLRISDFFLIWRKLDYICIYVMEAANYVIENKDGPDYQVGKENDFFCALI